VSVGDALPMLGMVLGTEDATPLEYWFAVSEGAKVQLDDLVLVAVPDPLRPEEEIHFYGVVDRVRRRLEGVHFEGDTALVVDGLLPAEVSYAAHVLVTRVDPEEFIPPGPGDTVFAAQGEALDKALYLDSMDTPLPAGVLRNGEPAYLNFDFIDGTKGAHINISGISGVATKTSYALFLLYSIFHARERGGERPLFQGSAGAKALIFNVKGEDLLFLDRPNARFVEEEGRWRKRQRSDRTRYEVCGLPEGPFESCEMHAPAKEAARGQALIADVSQREGVSPFVWSLHTFAHDRLLPFVLVDRDAMSNLGFLVQHIEEKLHRLAAAQRGPTLDVERFRHLLDDGGASVRGLGERIASDEVFDAGDLFPEGALPPPSADVERLGTFDDLVDFLEFKLLLQDADDEGGKGGDRSWTANQNASTREALIRRLRGAAKQLRRLIRGDLSAHSFARARLDILDSSKQVHVVDIHALPGLAQMFTVGVLLRQIFEQKERRSEKVFIVLDELNKYAPSEGSSPIKDVLLDIAERGRSLGVILIGAQQTASEVERRVVANAAVRVAGRLDAAEAERPEYRFMPSSFRSRATILAPGTMIVHQPDVPSPTMLTFPFPSWATRRREVDERVDDDEAADILG
jgi:DNA helicase HerA-like ATPase